MKPTLVFRARLLCALFIVVALLLVLRLYLVQIVHGEAYTRDANSQYVESGAETADRGTIYFTTKDGSLVAAAAMQSGWRIAIKPADIQDAGRTYRAIASSTPIDAERFNTAVAKTHDPYEEVAFRVSDEAADTIRGAKMPGVILVRDKWRTYPGGTLAAQAIGFVGFRGNDRAGIYGLERQWESTLAAERGGLYVNPFAEIFTNVEALITDDPAGFAGSIITTIEPSVQANLEKTLEKVMSTYSPRATGGIIMDPKTGDIVAIAGRPAYDPNTYNTVADPSVYTNVLVEGRYELGSIMKPLTVAIAIDSGALTPETTYNDTGCITRSTKKICNFDSKARGIVSVQQVLSQSLNVGAAFVGDRAGHGTLTKYMKAFGFGARTGIDLPGEVSGDISPLGDGDSPEVNYAAAAFGQGISVTPIGMTRVLASLGNDGKMPQPHIVSAIRYDSGITRTIEAQEPITVLSPETAHTVSRMLAEVFDKGLLGGDLKKERYSIAAKTGTAQIAKPGGGYYEDRYLHSFFGYFPAHEPRFIVFLLALEPKGVQYASASLAHPFADITDFLINYYDIPPDR